MLKCAPAFAAIAALLAPAAATAATQIIDGTGRLTGATGVTIGGSSYNLELVEGTCATVFGGCGGLSDFTFQTQADALVAAQALMAQVFIDAFDTNFTLTFGCADGASVCQALIPYALAGS